MNLRRAFLGVEQKARPLATESAANYEVGPKSFPSVYKIPVFF